MLREIYSSTSARLILVALFSVIVTFAALYAGLEPRIRFSLPRLGTGLLLGTILGVFLELTSFLLSKTRLAFSSKNNSDFRFGLETFEKLTAIVFIEALAFRGLLFAALSTSLLLAHLAHGLYVFLCYSLPNSSRLIPNRETVLKSTGLALEAVLYAEAFRIGGFTLSASMHAARLFSVIALKPLRAKITNK